MNQDTDNASEIGEPEAAEPVSDTSDAAPENEPPADDSSAA